ncbi:MAG TPA: hypothetical protein VGY57_03450 [Vicinamibacterales bacterium]|jgi:hypothetical protein|nr:hypothetical protein [Vicinamibacterales bacterium]
MRIARAAVILLAFTLAPEYAVIRAAPAAQAPAEPSLTKEQMQKFLSTAKVTGGRQTSKGITSPFKLKLTDGTLTHDAAFQSIEERRMRKDFGDGTSELNFVDSYLYDLAAYNIAELVGLDTMMPVTVPRSWNGMRGALSWWVPTLMDEKERLAKKIQPPPSAGWNDQMHRMRVFTALVYDTDRNLTNVLIDPDWKLWMIDFTRAFRLHPTLVNEKDLIKCDRNLLEKLKALNKDDVARVTKDLLTKSEAAPIMIRRDKIVEHFNKLVAEKGEAEVLY